MNSYTIVLVLFIIVLICILVFPLFFSLNSSDEFTIHTETNTTNNIRAIQNLHIQNQINNINFIVRKKIRKTLTIELID